MLDFRYLTFLTLCKTLSYTKTAEVLNMTQPAVSQHMKYLQEYYQVPLFFYEGKKLNLTPKGKILYEFVTTIAADNNQLEAIMYTPNTDDIPLYFGATLSIGEYIMPNAIKTLLAQYPSLSINMEVENTEILLSRLKEGKLNFALIEGYFNKTEYAFKPLMDAEFIAVCNPNSRFAKQAVSLEDLLDTRLILREKGSGSRTILQQLLQKHNLTIDNFALKLEVGNISAIKQLVSDDVGITFIYRAAVQRALNDGRLAQIKITGLSIFREFNFVYLKNSQYEKEYLNWYDQIKYTL